MSELTDLRLFKFMRMYKDRSTIFPLPQLERPGTQWVWKGASKMLVRWATASSSCLPLNGHNVVPIDAHMAQIAVESFLLSKPSMAALEAEGSVPDGSLQGSFKQK
jgi:hypothetical protein